MLAGTAMWGWAWTSASLVPLKIVTLQSRMAVVRDADCMMPGPVSSVQGAHMSHVCLPGVPLYFARYHGGVPELIHPTASLQGGPNTHALIHLCSLVAVGMQEVPGRRTQQAVVDDSGVGHHRPGPAARDAGVCVCVRVSALCVVCALHCTAEWRCAHRAWADG